MIRVLPAAAGLAGLLLAPLSAPASAQVADADTLFERGVSLHQAGDLFGAIEAYQAALEKEPQRVDARSNLGAIYARIGRYDEAIEQYRKVLAVVPDQAQVRFNLALALYKSARIPEAAEELEKVVAQQPDQRAPLLLLADCQLQMGKDAVVVALLSPHEEELKSDRLFSYLLGTALVRSNDLMRGQAYIDRVFREGDAAEARLLLGAAHLRRGDSRAAAPELEEAAKLKPDLPGLQSLLGRAMMGVGRRDEAEAAFRRELEKNPNDFHANLYLGMFLKEQARLDEAQEHLKRAGRLRPQDPAVLYLLGALDLAAGRTDEALKSLETVVAQVPGYRQAHVLMATAYYRLKNKELGDKHRDIAEKLRAEQQAREPGPVDELAPGLQAGQPSAPPSPAPGAPAGGTSRP